MAFDDAERWFNDKARSKPLGSFGRGEEWGKTILADFMPDWFQVWFKKKNWLHSSLCQGIKGWWIIADAYGIDEDRFWREVAP